MKINFDDIKMIKVINVSTGSELKDWNYEFTCEVFFFCDSKINRVTIETKISKRKIKMSLKS